MLSFSAFSQILKPNQTFTAKDTSVVLTAKQFNKLDSLLGDTLRYQKHISLLNTQAKVSDSLEGAYRKELQNDNTQIQLFQIKETLYKGQDSLLTQKAQVYKDLVTDLQKQAGTTAKGAGFFNNSFWFGTGALVGVVAVYVSSIILHNIK
jgi:CRISPR/Cas system-associated protein endoribonuclease Cas2